MAFSALNSFRRTRADKLGTGTGQPPGVSSSKAGWSFSRSPFSPVAIDGHSNQESSAGHIQQANFKSPGAESETIGFPTSCSCQCCRELRRFSGLGVQLCCKPCHLLSSSASGGCRSVLSQSYWMCISPSLCLTSDLDVLLLGPKASKAQGTLLLAEALLKVGLAGRL